ncbi:hypothetical protein LCO01nite_01940 [Lapidilactobacillus concavus]|jgi:hypothetical protein|nr:hypothetical protein LCO01nite_01940 [Lapidilactobacillus concavus]
MKYRIQLNTNTQIFTVIDTESKKSAEGITIQEAVKKVQF